MALKCGRKNKVALLTLALCAASFSFAMPALSAPAKTQQPDLFNVTQKEVENVGADLTPPPIPVAPSEDDEINAFTDDLLLPDEGNASGQGAAPLAPPSAPPVGAPAAPVAPVEPVPAEQTPAEPVVIDETVNAPVTNDAPAAPLDNDDSIYSPADNSDGDIPTDVIPPAPAAPVVPVTESVETGVPADAAAPVPDILTEQEQSEYKKLKTHLNNFVRSFSGGEVVAETPAEEVPADSAIPVASEVVPEGEQSLSEKAAQLPDGMVMPEDDIDTSAPPVTTPAPANDVAVAVPPVAPAPVAVDKKETVEPVDDFDDFLEAETAAPATEKEAPAPAAAPAILEKIQDKISVAQEKSIKEYAGNCAELPVKLAQCAEFSCSMKKAASDSVMINKIIAKNADGKCSYKELENNKPVRNCEFTEDGRKKMSEAIAKDLQSGGVPAFVIPADIAAQCPAIVDTAVAAAPSKPVVENKILPAPVKEEKKEVPLITKEDEAYFDLMKKKREALPKNKQLSDDAVKAIDGVIPSLAPKQKIKSEDDKIEIARGADLSSSVNEISISTKEDRAKKGFNVKEKMDSAYKALLSGQVSAAISIYKEVLDKDPDNKNALFGLATAYHKNAQYSQAREIYTKVLKKDPNNKEVLNNFLVLVAEESPDNALIELKKLERINSDFSPIPAQIGMIYLKMERPDQAERYFRRAVILSPDNVVYKYNLAITSDRLGKDDQAKRLYKEILDAAKQGAVIPGSASAISDRLEYLESKE